MRDAKNGRFVSGGIPPAERFWPKVDKTEGCWTWKAAKGRDGYGRFGKGGKYGGWLRAHRVAWELVNGPIPTGLFVCHRCDNPACVNPVHLFLGTSYDNVMDSLRKGRGFIPEPPMLRGEAHASSKLTEKQVMEIRERYAAGRMTQKTLAAEFGVTREAISRIITCRNWGWLSRAEAKSTPEGSS